MAEEKFFKDKYDVIIIGGALAGSACALQLAQKDVKNILILEQHNLPGGIATSFVRGDVEIEATLHEMMSIGNENQLKVGAFFKEMGVDIDWIRVPEAYRFISPDCDVVVHAGTHGDFETPAKEIASAAGDKDGSLYTLVLDFLNMCHKVYQAVNYVSMNHLSKAQMLLKFPELVKTAGYSAKEVMDAYKLPKKVQDMLSAYWIYVGNKADDLPMTIFAFLLADYLGYGSFIPKKFSHEMSVKLAEKCLEKGIQIEYGQRVEKILVENGRVKGVKTATGHEIKSDYVVSGAYPNTVYSRMIEPENEVPAEAVKLANARSIGLTCFSVVLLLDQSPEELGIKDYSTFYAPKGMNFDEIWKEEETTGPYNYITSICTNIANPDCTPKGTCIYSITALPRYNGWEKELTEENYEELKQKNARYFIEMESKRLGVNLFDHIKEVVIEAPATISHYTGAFHGSIYGYMHTMDDNIVARLGMNEEEHYIHGLGFAGAHQISGDGMGPAITNGRKGAKEILTYMAEDKEGK
ncbi:MAG: NAD(P)/FAD-dependent oxidoreductase [Bacilli bacterium]|jgi:prolycopene isomerase|nr:NAD(P)/FAD-dependent oxidoreductase [Bacilli bacterium]